MKLFYLFLLMIFSGSISAKSSLARMTNVQVDRTGNFIAPDTYHYLTGLKFYLKKDKTTAFNRFRFAAEFGSKKAAKFIGSMYLEGDGINQDLAKGLAWLKISADQESIQITKNILSKNPDLDIASINQEFESIKIDYGKSPVLNNIYKYYRRFKFQTLSKPNTIKFQGKNVVLNELQIMELASQVKGYYLEVKQNYGIVIQGEIVPKDNTTEKEKEKK